MQDLVDSRPTRGAGQPSREHESYRVLMIAPTSFFADYGCHVRILEEARILQKLGSRVTICTYHNGRNPPGIDVRRTASIPWRKDYEVGSSRHKVAFDALLFLRALWAMWQVKPHVVHAHLHEGALIGLVLAKLWRVPLVFDLQGSLTGEMIDHHFLSPNGPYLGPIRRLEELIDQAAPRILTSSTHSAELLATEFGCSRQSITTVPDCVDTDSFKPLHNQDERLSLKRAWGIPTQRTVVVYLGLLADYQGTDHLLEAARTICSHRDDVHFLIGGYPYTDHYRRLAGAMGLSDHVTFAGKVPYEDAARLLSLGDLAVCTKLSKTEGAGKLLNYMAMALPTVTFDSKVSREYLAEYGVYATRADSSDLARGLEMLVDDPQRRMELGAALRRRAQERYSWDVAGRTILQVYASMVH
ncbi:MAG TPA: glycosyltransferase family 4 protein [Anaerolineae bacterium]|nr:glycosyltransferase family 4 protein [Anaerolineae bacterium]